MYVLQLFFTLVSPPSQFNFYHEYICRMYVVVCVLDLFLANTIKILFVACFDLEAAVPAQKGATLSVFIPNSFLTFVAPLGVIGSCYYCPVC